VNVGKGVDKVTQGGVTFNQSAINDLLVLEVPAELNFKIGKLRGARLRRFCV